MTRWTSIIAVLLGLALGRTGAANNDSPAGEPPAPRPCAVRAPLQGVVNAGTAEYLLDALGHAEERGCALLVVLDTPGGELVATRRIVSGFLGASVPVVVYVAPGGARAGSAGMFITLAGHIAAMTPASNIGAAHPVLGFGQDPEDVGEQMARKVVSDVAAMARAVATERGRNADWAERAVRESVSATAGEALELGVIDVIAASESELLAMIDGREVEIRGEAQRLDTAGAAVEEFEMSLRQRALATLGDPNIAYLLLMIGLLGLLLELSSPGLIVPGVIGGLSLLLAAIGLNLLPVNFGGIALMVVGVGLLVAELYVTSYGLLLLAGAASLLAGSALLIDPADVDFFADPTLRVAWGAVIPLAVALAGIAAALAWYVHRTSRRPSVTGLGVLIGEVAETSTEVDEEQGWVRVAGESWQARTAGRPIPAGHKVRVVGVSGLSLEVEEVERERDRGGVR